MIDPERIKQATWRERGEVAWWWTTVVLTCLLIWALVIQAVLAWL